MIIVIYIVFMSFLKSIGLFLFKFNFYIFIVFVLKWVKYSYIIKYIYC